MTVKKYILPVISLFLLAAVSVLRFCFPGVQFVWPLIYGALGIAVILPGIRFHKYKGVLALSQIFFALFFSLAAAEIFFQARVQSSLKKNSGGYAALPGKRIWWDDSGSKYVLKNGKRLFVFSGSEVFVPGFEPMIFKPGSHGIHRSRRIFKDGSSTVTFEAEYTINSCGFRKVPFRSSSPHVLPLLFFGDSFTFGEGVDDNDVYVNHVARKLKDVRNIYNFALPGADPADFLSILKNGTLERSGLKGHLGTKAFYLIINDHKYRVIRNYGGKSRTFSSGDKVGRRICYWLKERLLFKSAVCDAIFNSIYRERFIRYLKEAEELLREKHKTELIIAVYPDCMPDVRKSLHRAGFKLFFLDKYLPDYKGYHSRMIDLKYEIPYDGHPTPSTHKLIAGAIMEYLKNNNIAPQKTLSTASKETKNK